MGNTTRLTDNDPWNAQHAQASTILRLAYFVHLNLGPQRSGVFKKIIAHVAAWKKAGHIVHLFIVTRSLDVSEAMQPYCAAGEATVVMYGGGSRIRRLVDRFRSFRELADNVITWHPDVVYTRQDLYYSAVARIARSAPLVVEVNSFDLIEMWTESKIKWAYHALTRKAILNRSAGLVYVAKEIAEDRFFRKLKALPTVIGNGVALDAIKATRVGQSPDVRLVFVGAVGCPWHGVDKILALAGKCPDWWFDIVGISQVELANAPENVTAHGQLARSEYGALLAEADCALGTLALHRNGMSEASPLKTREYLAYGLPVIIAYRDTDFPNGAEFLLELPNTEENILENVESIRRFVTTWKGRRVSREAIDHLDTVRKEGQRLAFFHRVITKAKLQGQKEICVNTL